MSAALVAVRSLMHVLLVFKDRKVTHSYMELIVPVSSAMLGTFDSFSIVNRILLSDCLSRKEKLQFGNSLILFHFFKRNHLKGVKLINIDKRVAHVLASIVEWSMS